MRQLSYVVDNSKEIEEVFKSIKEEPLYYRGKSRLMQIYCPLEKHNEIEEILCAIKKEDTDMLTVGLTTYDTISNGRHFADKIVLSVYIFEDSTVDIYVYDRSVTTENIFDYFKKHIDNAEYIAGIQVYATNAFRFNSDLIENISSKDYPIFGAVAAQNEKGKCESSKIFTDKIYDNGSIMIIYKGENLYIDSDFCLGWRPLGKELTITKVNESFCVEEIDGLPAAYIYDKYLNVKPDKYFIDNTYEFPLSIVRNGRLISRAPYDIDEAGRLYFNADIRPGEKVRLSYGNTRYVLNDALKLSMKLQKNNLDSIMLIACYNRRVLLGEDVDKEISYFSSISESVNGCYAFSEFMSNGDKGGVLHSSLVAVGIREGKGKEKIINDSIYNISHEEVSGKIPFTERLMHFLEATTQDIVQMATTDQLTGLMNRRNVEDIFNYESSKRKNKNNLAVILLDVDFFKKVNDNYGHEAGDYVLVKLAEIFKENIRIEDTAGRWGGEEFIIILPETGMDSAIEVGERIRSSVENTEFKTFGKITISGGITIKKHDENINQVIIRADKALYQAKNNGRNQMNFL